MKRCLIGLIGAGIVVALVAMVGGATSAVEQMSAERTASVKQNCESIKISLERLRVADSEVRAYLGKVFETTLNNYVTVLNVRLVKNNLVNVNLTLNQAKLTTTKNDFSASFVKYARSLDDLLKTDCVSDPQGFLNLLQSVRNNRSEVRTATSKIVNLTSEHEAEVKKMMEKL